MNIIERYITKRRYVRNIEFYRNSKRSYKMRLTLNNGRSFSKPFPADDLVGRRRIMRTILTSADEKKSSIDNGTIFFDYDKMSELINKISKYTIFCRRKIDQIIYESESMDKNHKSIIYIDEDGLSFEDIDYSKGGNSSAYINEFRLDGLEDSVLIFGKLINIMYNPKYDDRRKIAKVVEDWTLYNDEESLEAIGVHTQCKILNDYKFARTSLELNRKTKTFEIKITYAKDKNNENTYDVYTIFSCSVEDLSKILQSMRQFQDLIKEELDMRKRP